MTTIAYLNGEYLLKEQVRISPDDRGFMLADGVYEVVRSYGGGFFRLQDHLNRLARGLAELRIDGVDVAGLEVSCHELLDRNGMDAADALIYLQVTRGVAPRVHAFPPNPVPPTVYASVLPIIPPSDPLRGSAVITVPDLRWLRCDIKSIALLPNCLANQQAQEAGAGEAIFVRDGVALEGTATAFFGVFGGEVRTVPKSNYILPSITRDVVLGICSELGLPWREAPIFLHELPRADELFVAGTTKEIMPVVQVDERRVGDGQPGSITRRLQDEFRARRP